MQQNSYDKQQFQMPYVWNQTRKKERNHKPYGMRTWGNKPPYKYSSSQQQKGHDPRYGFPKWNNQHYKPKNNQNHRRNNNDFNFSRKSRTRPDSRPPWQQQTGQSSPPAFWGWQPAPAQSWGYQGWQHAPRGSYQMSDNYVWRPAGGWSQQPAVAMPWPGQGNGAGAGIWLAHQ